MASEQLTPGSIVVTGVESSSGAGDKEADHVVLG